MHVLGDQVFPAPCGPCSSSGTTVGTQALENPPGLSATLSQELHWSLLIFLASEAVTRPLLASGTGRGRKIFVEHHYLYCTSFLKTRICASLSFEREGKLSDSPCLLPSLNPTADSMPRVPPLVAPGCAQDTTSGRPERH